MAQTQLDIIVQLQDQATKGLRDIQKSLGNLGKDLKTFSPFTDAMSANLSKIGGAFQQLSQTALPVLQDVIMTTAEYDRQLKRVAAFGGEEFQSKMAELSEQAKDFGKSTKFAASEVAAAQVELAKAGFSALEVMDQIPSVLDLAAGSELEMADASAILGTTLRQFGLQAKDAAMTADILADAASSSNQDLMDLGESLKYVAVPAKQLGLDARQTSVLLAALANQGIKASMAGTNLRAAFVKLANVKHLTPMLRQLKISTKEYGDAIANKDIPKALDLIRKGMDRLGLSEAKRTVGLQKVFDVRGANAVGALINSLAQGDLQKLQADLGSAAGEAKRMRDVMASGMVGDIDSFKSALEGLKISIGEKLAPAFKTLLVEGQKLAAELETWVGANDELISQWVEEMVPAVKDLVLYTGKAAFGFAEWAKENDELIKTWGPLLLKVAAFGTVLGPAMTTVSSFTTIISGVPQLFKLVGKSAIGMGAQMTAVFGPAGAIALAAGAGYLVIKHYNDKTIEAIEEGTRFIRENAAERAKIYEEMNASQLGQRVGQLMGSRSQLASIGQEKSDLENMKALRANIAAHEKDPEWASAVKAWKKSLAMLENRSGVFQKEREIGDVLAAGIRGQTGRGVDAAEGAAAMRAAMIDREWSAFQAGRSARDRGRDMETAARRRKAVQDAAMGGAGMLLGGLDLGKLVGAAGSSAPVVAELRKLIDEVKSQKVEIVNATGMPLAVRPSGNALR